MTKKCPRCNADNTDVSKFCMKCGQQLPNNSIHPNQSTFAQKTNQPPTKKNNNKTILKIIIILAIIGIALLGYQYYCYDQAYHDHDQHYILQEDEDTFFCLDMYETSDAYYVNNMEVQVYDSIVENPVVFLTIYNKNATVLAEGEFIPPRDVKQDVYGDNSPSTIWHAYYDTPIKLTKTNATGTPYTIIFSARNIYDDTNTKMITHKFNETELENITSNN